ncbi:tripartite tricarboxylate transporter substrate binding protein [Polaromonas sp. P1(28)-13]|nr:tripartite tricarboxylate transporter substrate binding protein [Polaromonas sp. P1(28)-13]
MAFAAVSACAVIAQDYPNRPIKLILGFSAGGSTDSIGRYYAQKMSELLKTPVVIDNKPGAGQIIAIKTVMAAQPDGYTLYLGSGSVLSQGPGVRNDLPYDPLKDMTLVGMVATAPGLIVVTPKLPVKSMQELISYAKEHPNELNYGSSGVGSASHLQGEYLKKLTGMKMAHIPYKADADIMREMTAGSVHVGLSPVQGAMSPIASGRVRALAVTGSRRLVGMPDVPSLKETNIKGLDGIDPYTYYGIAGPVGLARPVIDKLNEAINAIAKSPEAVVHVREKLFAESASGSPEAFRAYIETDLKKWKEFGKFVKLTE